jgi:peptide deformylase
MIKLVTDTSVLKKVIPTTPFTKEEQDLATAALLTAVTQHQGLGMSANQIGLNKRICVINVKEQPLVLVNPQILDEGQEKLIYFEGCLSLPKTMKKPIKTVRSYNVKVKADNFPDVLEFGTGHGHSAEQIVKNLKNKKIFTFDGLKDYLQFFLFRFLLMLH